MKDQDLGIVAGKRLLDARLGGVPSADARFLTEYAGGGGAGAAARVAGWERAARLEPGWLDEKLAALGLTRAALAGILAGGGVPRDPRPPAWRARLDDVLGRARPLPDEALLRVDDEHAGERVPFWSFARWFLAYGAERLRDAALLAPAAAVDLLRGLATQLGHRLHPTLILELHRARAAGALAGATPRARYEGFAARFADAGAARALLDEYPLLGRQLVETVERWSDATLEMLARHAAEDGVFAGAARGRLARVVPHLSDPHHGNRAVAILEDEAGRRVVYKPRSLAVDEAFFGFVDWLNRLGLPLGNRLLGAIDRGAFGWMEHAAAAPVEDQAAAGRFFWRQGSLLALLHFLRGQDFHYQNVIAMGEHPVFLDLEAILAPRFPLGGARLRELREAADAPGSVLETGLLLRPVRGPDGRETDLSGFGGGEEQKVVRPGLLDAYTDHMRVGLRERTIPAGENRPRLGGRAVPARAHAGAVIDGFRTAYDLLTGAREELAARLRACAGLEVRFIPRHTQRYGILAQESAHPDYLRDVMDTELLLDILHLEAHVLPVVRRIIVAEQADLRRGDFPRFTARPGERHLYDAHGGRIDDFFERGSLELALERLAAAGAADRERQVAAIAGELGGEGGRVDAAA